MLILHANWNEGALCLWAESLDAYAVRCAASTAHADEVPHPFTAPADTLQQRLMTDGLLEDGWVESRSTMRMQLPSDGTHPQPSDRLVSTLGTVEDNAGISLIEVAVPCLRLHNAQAAAALLHFDTAKQNPSVRYGASMRYWTTVGRFVLELLVDQRFIPTLIQKQGQGLIAAWQPWLADSGVRSRVASLLAVMFLIARVLIDRHHHRAWPILSEALSTLTDAIVREVLAAEDFGDAICERDPASDPHVAWLTGLLDTNDMVPSAVQSSVDLLRDASAWVHRLDETGQGLSMKLCFRLHEPLESTLGDIEAKSTLPQSLTWRLSLHLQAVGDSGVMIDAKSLWRGLAMENGAGSAVSVGQSQELLLKELGRASRVYGKVEDALAEQHPSEINLTTQEAHEFLCEHKPVLEESGFRVMVPKWWDEPSSRIGARLHIESPELAETEQKGQSGEPVDRSYGLGLNAIVDYQWQIAVGDQPLTMDEFQQLVQQQSPLVYLRGRWVEVRSDDMKRAVQFLRERPGGRITLLEAIQVAYGTDGHQPGFPVTGLDATGWVGRILGTTEEDRPMPLLDQPLEFSGQLRPYQKTGLSWLAFLDRFGLGACLADDMGLGKTIQLIALLLYERNQEGAASNRESVGPTLLVVPTSVVSNWVRELQRFAPNIRAYVHHGPDRTLDRQQFHEVVANSDVVITTYALMTRDREVLTSIDWHRVTLDEAQYIKNPPTKQTAAIRALRAPRRIAMTGTPVENRLTELWSIMEFCNPGYLGSFTEFRKRFAVPIEKHRDQQRANALRSVVRPFILRRLKSDPNVITDLPLLFETKEYATLTHEQASLYEHTVNEMLAAIDRAEGIQRRGLVLATLVKLKQICNHPAQIAVEHSARIPSQDGLIRDGVDIGQSLLSQRSGKARRLLELLEEVVASGERALVFTQFRRMGHLLTAMIQSDLDVNALFLHGGTPSPKRQEMIDAFQSESTTAPPIFVLSLKAGGLGLNLTAANHVFHFDRWWNPAVENQATDRVFRIGQTKNVQVHKFVCTGTLEERIDQMLEQKTELAENIIGSGEAWLTELSTGQLHDMLTLRRHALEVDA